MIFAYTDGASLGNPGPGAFAVIIVNGDTEIKLAKGYRLTTNNRMELMAILETLRFCLLNNINEVTIFTDSQLVANSINQNWLEKWANNKWKGSNKKEVKNIDIWKEIYELLKKVKTDVKWLSGHSGYKYNELCDKLAKKTAKESATEIDYGYENSINKNFNLFNGEGL